MWTQFGFIPRWKLMDEAHDADNLGASSGSGAGAEGSAGKEGEAGKEGAEGQAKGPVPKPGDKPDDEKANLIKDLMKWKGKARETETEMEALKAQVAEFAKLQSALGGLNLDEVKTLASQKKDAERQEAEKKGEYDRIVAQMKEENQKLLQATEAEKKALLEANLSKESLIETLTVGRAFSDSAYIRESSTLPSSIAQKEFGSYFEFVDGRLIGFDKPRGASERTKLVDADGEPKSFDLVIEQLYAKHPDAKSLIKAKRKSGGAGSDNSGAGAKAADPKIRGLSRIERGLTSSS